MEVKHDGKGGVKVLASPKKDERHAYTPDQARHIADLLVASAQEAQNYLVSVAHQEMVNAPNPHAAQEPADETVAPDRPANVAENVTRADASTPTAPTPTTLDATEVEHDTARAKARAAREKAQERAAKRATPKKRVRSQASKDAAAKKAREKRAAAKKAK